MTENNALTHGSLVHAKVDGCPVTGQIEALRADWLRLTITAPFTDVWESWGIPAAATKTSAPFARGETATPAGAQAAVRLLQSLYRFCRFFQTHREILLARHEEIRAEVMGAGPAAAGTDPAIFREHRRALKRLLQVGELTPNSYQQHLAELKRQREWLGEDAPRRIQDRQAELTRRLLEAAEPGGPETGLEIKRGYSANLWFLDLLRDPAAGLLFLPWTALSPEETAILTSGDAAQLAEISLPQGYSRFDLRRRLVADYACRRDQRGQLACHRRHSFVQVTLRQESNGREYIWGVIPMAATPAELPALAEQAAQQHGLRCCGWTAAGRVWLGQTGQTLRGPATGALKELLEGFWARLGGPAGWAVVSIQNFTYGHNLDPRVINGERLRQLGGNLLAAASGYQRRYAGHGRIPAEREDCQRLIREFLEAF